MSLFFPRRSQEKRAIDPSAFVRGETTSIGTSPERALSLVPVYASIRLLSDAVASLPMSAYRKKADDEREKVSPAPSLLTNPSAFGTSYDWVHRAMVSLLAHGNAYGLITQTDRQGWPSQIEWLHPSMVYVDESRGAPHYYYDGRPIRRSELLHIVGFSQPGSVVGMSPIAAFATTVDTGLYAQSATRDWYRNGAIPAATLENTSQVISSEDAREIKARYRETVKSGDVLVHGNDWKFDVVGISAQDAQFLDAIKANATQIAAIFGIPPEKIGGETGSSMTYATTEQQAIDFLMFSVRPWVVRLEKALADVLPGQQFVKFNVDSMIRTDIKTRWEVYTSGVASEILTINEVRALEERPPVPWGDEPKQAPAPVVMAAPADEPDEDEATPTDDNPKDEQ